MLCGITEAKGTCIRDHEKAIFESFRLRAEVASTADNIHCCVQLVRHACSGYIL